jgi:hypothetical protein
VITKIRTHRLGAQRLEVIGSGNDARHCANLLA